MKTIETCSTLEIKCKIFIVENEIVHKTIMIAPLSYNEKMELILFLHWYYKWSEEGEWTKLKRNIV